MASLSPEERSIILASFARLLSDRCRQDDVRRIMATASGHDPALWSALTAMGLPALLVPAEYTGIGGGAVELEAIMEEAGAALLPGPLSAAAVAADMIARSADAAAHARLLPPIAAGALLATVAWGGDAGRWTHDDVEVTATPKGDRWRLDGTASFVAFANVADVLLVVARTADGLRCLELEARGDGVEIAPLRTWDPTLRLSRIRFADAAARPLAGINQGAIRDSLDLARVALAGEQAGAARRIFDITVDYMKQRVQFGRPIGGFQALKHIVADLLIEVESATSAARAAARGLAAAAPDRDALVALAAFTCADAFSQVAAAAIQLHGGIAFTWEHVAHLYLRRARAAAQLFGTADGHRERFLAALEQAA